MKLSISRLNTRLAVIANCYDPATLEATDPSVATVTFLKEVNGALQAAALGTLPLVTTGITGVWSAMVNIAGVDVSNLVAVVKATVGGVVMTEVLILGRSVNTGSPSILIESTDKNGDPNFGISK